MFSNIRIQSAKVAFLSALALALSGCAVAIPVASPAQPQVVMPRAAPLQVQAQATAVKPLGLSAAQLNRAKFPDASLMTSEAISFIGRPIKIEGAGFPAGTKIKLVWGTFDGSFKLGEQLEFSTYAFTERNTPIADVVADANGKFTTDFKVPEDYGGVHNIYALVDGEKIGQAGLTVRTEYFVSPLSGPVGTLINVKITGIGYAKWEESRSIAYDNAFTGIMNAIMTRGTATAQIRASGGVGKHILRIASGAMMPYMNVQQSPNYFPGRVQDYEFTVTSLEAVAASTLAQAEWANRNYPELDANPGLAGPKGETLTVVPNRGTVGKPMKLKAAGFAPNTKIELSWEAMRGNRNSGWTAQPFPLETITTDGSGNFERELKMPDDLGGSHALMALVYGKRIADARVVIEPNILDMSPKSGPAGTDLKIVLKGVGWTEVDNVYVMTYDNAITGYACGFNSAGDVTINMKATGAPGWHFIDLYPSVYLGHIEPPWIPDQPWLSFASHPGLPKPALHLAFKITE